MAQPSAGRTRYQHRPLKNADSIRLFHLQPGGFTDDIHVTLTEVSLSKPPSYEALSYVWGSPTANDPISCHGEELLVTANCIAAMRRLRHKRKRRVLWIDAICIAQDSMNERNHQVRLMGGVYSKATRVIIWLGEETALSNSVISFLKDYHRILTRKWLLPFRGRLLDKKEREFENMVKMTEGDELWRNEVLTSICDCPWFTRKWAIQEYVLSRDSYFQCGGKRLQSSKLFQAVKHLDEQVGHKENFVYVFMLKSSFWAYLYCFNQLKQNLTRGEGLGGFSYLDIFNTGRCQLATNPKDAILGLYGMLQKLQINVPPPDYSQSVEQIYTKATKSVIVHDKSLLVLQQTSESRDWPDLPSWVPDWNQQLNHGMREESQFDPSFSTSKNDSAKFTFLSDNKSISVRGCFVGKITRAAKAYIVGDEDVLDFPEFQRDSEMEWQGMVHIEAYLEWIEMVTTLTTDAKRENSRTTLFSTLVSIASQEQDWVDDCFGSWLQSFLPSIPKQLSSKFQISPSMSLPDTERDSGNTSQKGSDTLKGSPHDKKRDYDAIWAKINGDQKACRFHVLAFHYCKGTRLFITSEGYLGKGLKAIREGDLVALIAGVDVPMIIRKEGDLYRLKGPAYIHGMMNGEKWPTDENDLIDIVLS